MAELELYIRRDNNKDLKGYQGGDIIQVREVGKMLAWSDTEKKDVIRLSADEVEKMKIVQDVLTVEQLKLRLVREGDKDRRQFKISVSAYTIDGKIETVLASEVTNKEIVIEEPKEVIK